MRFARELDALEVNKGKIYAMTAGQVADPTVLDRRLSTALDLARELTE